MTLDPLTPLAFLPAALALDAIRWPGLASAAIFAALAARLALMQRS